MAKLTAVPCVVCGELIPATLSLTQDATTVATITLDQTDVHAHAWTHELE